MHEKVREEIEENLENSVITANDLQVEILGPLIIEEYGKEISKGMKNDKYMDILYGYTKSKFQDFECSPRIEVDLVEDDISLVLV